MEPKIQGPPLKKSEKGDGQIKNKNKNKMTLKKQL
jgi:hypothetical protein